MLPTVSLQCDLGYSRWYGMEGRLAESPLKCTLPTGVGQSSGHRQESKCSHTPGEEVIPSKGDWRAENTVIPRSVERVWGDKG